MESQVVLCLIVSAMLAIAVAYPQPFDVPFAKALQGNPTNPEPNPEPVQNSPMMKEPVQENPQSSNNPPPARECNDRRTHRARLGNEVYILKTCLKR